MKTRKQLAEAVLAAKSKRWTIGSRIGKRYTYRDIAKEMYPLLDVNQTAALLNKIVLNPDYNPGREVCERLHIVYSQPTPVCALHGVVHCYDCQTQETRPKRNGGPRIYTYARVYIPAVSESERRAISGLTPEERKAALLEAAQRKGEG